MTVWPLKISYGLVEISGNETVESFTEKPTLDKWINIGYFYINTNYRDLSIAESKADVLRELMLKVEQYYYNIRYYVWACGF